MIATDLNVKKRPCEDLGHNIERVSSTQHASTKEKLKDPDSSSQLNVPLIHFIWQFLSQIILAQTSSHKRVRFNEEVSSLWIPTRADLSDRMQDMYWRDMGEFHVMVNKNLQEFAAEGFNPQYVFEEEQFATCRVTGEKVHPAFAAATHELQFYDDEADSDLDGGVFYDDD